MNAPRDPTPRKRTSLLAALRNAVLVGAALCVAPSFAAPASGSADKPAASASADKKKASGKKAASKPDAAAAKKRGKAVAKKEGGKASASSKDARPSGKKASASKGRKDGKKEAAARKAQEQKPGPLADFGKEKDSAPADVVHVANWVSHTRNNQNRAFVLIDKKMARLYVFDRKGKLKSSTPVLLGKAVGDFTAPGSGSKPLSQLTEEEKTTPAGRFVARPGKNNHGEDIIWIDYDAAVSMHRLRKVKEEERRFERMATEDVSDNRISNGCVNVPHAFYNKILRPTVMKQGALVYVLPETRTPQQQFGSWDVADKAVQLAQAGTKTQGTARQ